MPRMQGAAVQCCMCITGVFMFLGGVIMLSTGICLILNYGIFDVEFLPPDLQNDEGKKTVGIILTCCGLVAILISVVVSLMYLCNKTKSPIVIPDDLTRSRSSSRNRTPDRYDRRTPDRYDRGRSDRGGHVSEKQERRSSSGKPAMNGSKKPQTRSQTKSIPGSTEVVMPRQAYKRKHNKKYPRRRLEGIKEQDAVSRKTAEGVIAIGPVDPSDDTPRSGSFSSEMTNDEMRIPKVVLERYDDDRDRRPSQDSTSTFQTNTSDGSNYRPLDNDKSRRELQFIPSTVMGEDSPDMDDNYYKDSVSILQKDETSVMYNKGRDSEYNRGTEGEYNRGFESEYNRGVESEFNRGRESEDSSVITNFAIGDHDSSLSNTNTETSAGGSDTQPESAQLSSYTAPPSDYKAHSSEYTAPPSGYMAPPSDASGGYSPPNATGHSPRELSEYS